MKLWAILLVSLLLGTMLYWTVALLIMKTDINKAGQLVVDLVQCVALIGILSVVLILGKRVR